MLGSVAYWWRFSERDLQRSLTGGGGAHAADGSRCPGTCQGSCAGPAGGKACGIGVGDAVAMVCFGALPLSPVHHPQLRLKAEGLGVSNQAVAGQGGAQCVPVCGQGRGSSDTPCTGDHLPGVTNSVSRPQGAGDKGTLAAEVMMPGVDSGPPSCCLGNGIEPPLRLCEC